MDHPPRRRVGAMSKVACTACRRLKMKCIGAEKPPCVRCTKTGRHCLTQQSDQQHGSRNAQIFQNGSQNPSSTLQSMRYAPSNLAKESRLGQDIWPILKPSTYHNYSMPASTSGPGLEAATSQGYWSSASLDTSQFSSNPTFQYPLSSHQDQDRKVAVALPLDSTSNSTGGSRNVHGDVFMGIIRDEPCLPSDEDVMHLAQFFVTNLLHHIPVLRQSDLAGIGTPDRANRPLALCVAYVTARFMPGCKAIESSLTRYVATIARLQSEQYFDSESVEESQWSQLQALAILYNWAPSQRPDASTATELDGFPPELRQDMLLASIETLARRYSLHRSAGNPTELLNLNIQNTQRDFAFRRHLYWLWLFGEAHFRALVSHSPPSIREDASIVQGVQLLRRVTNDNCARQILSRVDLCLLWSQGALREHTINEWWCSIQVQMDLESSLALLDDLEGTMQSWHRAWHRAWHPTKQVPSVQEADKAGEYDAMEFYYHFTSYCLSNHVATVMLSSKTAESLPPSRIHSLTKTMDRGHMLCRSFLELSPLARNSIYFGPEIIFTMIANCCESLLRIIDLPGASNVSRSVHLGMIRHVAERMVELSIDERRGAKSLGQSLLITLRNNEAIRTPSVAQRPTAQHKRRMTWTAGRDQQQVAPKSHSFVPVTNDALSTEQATDQRELANRPPEGFVSGPAGNIAMWAPYHANDPATGTASFGLWTS